MEQPRSRLLSLPSEIRREIFTFVLAPGATLHLYLEDGHPRVSPCLGAGLGEEVFEERSLYREHGLTAADQDAGWARRLSSTWANHYMCEEVRDGKRFLDHPQIQTRGYTSALLVCKQMQTECSEILGRLLEVTVTDLDAAQYLIRLSGSNPETDSADPEAPSADCDTDSASIPYTMLRSSRSLNLSLYRDPELYCALSLPESLPGGWTPTGDMALRLFERYSPKGILQAIPQADLWRQFWAGLSMLPRLSRVTVWLDNNIDTWSDMDEKAILSPMLEAAERLQGVKLAVHLPEICKDEISHEKHFVAGDGDLQLPLDIQRANRRPFVAADPDLGLEAYIICRWFLRRSGHLKLRELR